MTKYTYYFNENEEIKLRVVTPAYAGSAPSLEHPGDAPEPAEYDLVHMTFLGVACTKSPAEIAAALWPDDAEARAEFETAYAQHVENACNEADDYFADGD